MLIEVLFWFCVIFIFYAYFGYPLALMAISVFRSRRIRKGDITPEVSFIITAYNEEQRIRQKIENTLKQDYDRNKLDIIVASDCSTDKTDEIVKSFQPEGVRLVRAVERRGKENAQKCAVQEAKGDIFVFSDVATILRPDGIRNIVKNFNDPTVGCVSSVDRFIERDGKISGEGVYVRYEMLLRAFETRANTLVGLSGSFFAARKEVCRNWASDLQSDFNTLLNSIRLGLRGVSDPESTGYYKNITDEKKEFDRKVRTVQRGIFVFMRSIPMINPLRFGLFSWQLLSHKLCRWLVPFAMILVFGFNLFLIKHSYFYSFTFAFQSAFYGMALLGIKTGIFYRSRFLKLPSFFLLVNISILDAWYRYLKGERMVRWEPSER